jgi:hypothetical protein
MQPSTPISEKRLAANRANAQHSTGPRTPEGKARSSQNAVKHGFTGSHFSVVRFEDIHEVGNLKCDAVACYRPVNAAEMAAVERIALARLKILRGYRMEAGLFTFALDDALDPTDRPIRPLCVDTIDGNIPVTRAQNRNFILAEGLRRMAGKDNLTLPLLLRYQVQADREYRRAVEDFERLKSLRPEFPNEPIWQEEIQEIHELATLDELHTTIPDSYQPFDYNPAPELREVNPNSPDETNPTPASAASPKNAPDGQRVPSGRGPIPACPSTKSREQLAEIRNLPPTSDN